MRHSPGSPTRWTTSSTTACRTRSAPPRTRTRRCSVWSACCSPCVTVASGLRPGPTHRGRAPHCSGRCAGRGPVVTGWWRSSEVRSPSSTTSSATRSTGAASPKRPRRPPRACGRASCPRSGRRSAGSAARTTHCASPTGASCWPLPRSTSPQRTRWGTCPPPPSSSRGSPRPPWRPASPSPGRSTAPGRTMRDWRSSAWARPAAASSTTSPTSTSSSSPNRPRA